MMEPGDHTLLAGRVSSMYLDYGADEQSGGEDAVEISERGMKLRSRWHFEIGTELSVSVVCEHPSGERVRVKAEGIVVWCEQVSGEPVKSFESTVLFLDLPEDLKQSLRDFSCRVAADELSATQQ
jgi:hypothetical protein